jgi:hypothetical protein
MFKKTCGFFEHKKVDPFDNREDIKKILRLYIGKYLKKLLHIGGV